MDARTMAKVLYLLPCMQSITKKKHFEFIGQVTKVRVDQPTVVTRAFNSFRRYK